MKFFIIDLNLCSVLFVGVVSMINPCVLCILCQLGYCGFVGTWRYTNVLWLASVDVNLCVVVCGCSPIINFVVAFCCMYWVALCQRVSGLSCVLWLPRVTLDVFNLLCCVLWVHYVPCGACKIGFVGKSCSSCCLVLRFMLKISFVFWIVGVVTINLDAFCRMYFVPVLVVVNLLACWVIGISYGG